MNRQLTRLKCWTVGAIVYALRATCRFRPHNDPRPRLRAEGVTYVYAILHAHQLSAVMGAEKGCGAMVSRSADGEILAAAVEMCGLVPIRGSGGRGARQPGKGAVSALQAIIRHVRGGNPATLAVDGPKGPRGQVQRGIAMLSQKTSAPVVTVVLVPRRRWVFAKSWDRTQIPMPFTRIDGYFAPELESREGESVESFSLRIQESLNTLDQTYDPSEAAASVAENPTPVGAVAAAQKRAA